jgi:hypothetical protein
VLCRPTGAFKPRSLTWRPHRMPQERRSPSGEACTIPPFATGSAA